MYFAHNTHTQAGIASSYKPSSHAIYTWHVLVTKVYLSKLCSNVINECCSLASHTDDDTHSHWKTTCLQVFNSIINLHTLFFTR